MELLLRKDHIGGVKMNGERFLDLITRQAPSRQQAQREERHTEMEAERHGDRGSHSHRETETGGKERAMEEVHAPSLIVGSNLFLRGSGCGLNWDQGILLAHSSRDRWEAQLPLSSCTAAAQGKTAVDGDRLEFKALVDDQTWQVRANGSSFCAV
jgi:hypothetical protein